MAREGRSLTDSPLPETLVYKIDRSAHAVLLLVWLFAIGCGVLLRDANAVVGWIIIAIFSISASLKFVNLLPGATRLTLNRDDFILRKLYRNRAVRWDEIALPFTKQIGPQLAIGYLCSDPYRRDRLSRWYHRALLGMDGWIVVWNFRPQLRSIPNAIDMFWHRARPELKVRHWQPDRLIFEGNTILAWIFLLPCFWLASYPVGILLAGGALSQRGWTFLVALCFAAVGLLWGIVPGSVRLTLTLEGFELRWYWRRRIVKWRDVGKPVLQKVSGPSWTWKWEVVCQYHSSNQTARKLAGFNYLVPSQQIQIPRFLPRDVLLKFMADFWERAQTATAPLDLPGSKD